MNDKDVVVMTTIIAFSIILLVFRILDYLENRRR